MLAECCWDYGGPWGVVLACVGALVDLWRAYEWGLYTDWVVLLDGPYHRAVTSAICI